MGFNFLGEDRQPIVWEAAEAVWNRRGVATEERSASICEMAEGGSNSAEEDDSQATLEGPTCLEPVH